MCVCVQLGFGHCMSEYIVPNQKLQVKFPPGLRCVVVVTLEKYLTFLKSVLVKVAIAKQATT